MVTGVQNHQPASIEFDKGGAREILYGLGNFSFDQMYSDEVRQGLIPRHLIYNGKLLQTELLTTMLDKYAQPRWATPQERDTILRAVFEASRFELELFLSSQWSFVLLWAVFCKERVMTKTITLPTCRRTAASKLCCPMMSQPDPQNL